VFANAVNRYWTRPGVWLTPRLACLEPILSGGAQAPKRSCVTFTEKRSSQSLEQVVVERPATLLSETPRALATAGRSMG